MPILYDSDDDDSDDDESDDGSSDAEDDGVEDDVVIVRDDGGKILQMEEEDFDDVGEIYWSDPTPNIISNLSRVRLMTSFSDSVSY